MKLLRYIFRCFLFLISIIFLYVFASIFLSSFTVHKNQDEIPKNDIIYLSTNGVHLDIIIPENALDSHLFKGLNYTDDTTYLSFGWGDENFYINTPTWSDLTAENAFRAIFLPSTSLMHVTHYDKTQHDWIQIYVSEEQLNQLNQEIAQTFVKDKNHQLIMITDVQFTSDDNFYKAKGNYSLFNTCNSWVNGVFKKSGLKSCLWTAFDVGLLRKYQD